MGLIKVNSEFSGITKNSIFYHGTIYKYAHNICDIDKRFDMDKCHVGTLGRGAYAFYSNKQDAINFAHYKSKKIRKNKSHYPELKNKDIQPKVLGFKLKEPNDVLVWNEIINEKFIKFVLNNRFERSAITTFKDHSEYNNRSYSKALDGAIIDSFLFKKAEKYGGLLRLSYNHHATKLSSIIPGTLIPNSTELCIKNNSIVDFNSMTMYNC